MIQIFVPAAHDLRCGSRTWIGNTNACCNRGVDHDGPCGATIGGWDGASKQQVSWPRPKRHPGPSRFFAPRERGAPPLLRVDDDGQIVETHPMVALRGPRPTLEQMKADGWGNSPEEVIANHRAALARREAAILKELEEVRAQIEQAKSIRPVVARWNPTRMIESQCACRTVEPTLEAANATPTGLPEREEV